VDFVESYDIQTIEAWNNSVPEPIEHCIHQFIELQAKLNPNSPAVYSCDPSVSLSYQELNNMADNMAQYLSTLGVGPESLVPFCLDKSHLTPVTMVAILKAGGACVALDPSQPRIRLQGIIRDSGANVIMSAPQYISLFSDLVPHVVSVEETTFRQGLSSHNSLGPTSPVQHNNPAFVIFTSGSTGTPKGIVVEHGAFCSSARSHAPALRLGQSSRVLQFASHTYDLSIAENLTTLMVGGCICVPSEYQKLNCLADAINAMQVDWMFLTPTVAALLRPDEVPTVKTLVLGGEHATQNNFSTWGSRPGVCLINSYGPAECAIWTNANVEVQANADTSNIGPRLGCSLWIVDPRNHHRLMPIGARGELVIGGPTLARGYLHSPVQTDAAFIRSPGWFKGASGISQRFYKSGDLARYNLDGTLSIQGRKDTQVKVHGHRIELGDIDRNIAQIPSVEHVTVQLPRSGPAQDQLVALVSLNELPRKSTESTTPLKIITLPDHRMFATPILNSIRSQLEQQLPRHMLPTLWIIVERIPLLSSGKLDKQAVKAWLHNLDQEIYNQARSLSQFEADPSSALPETPTELELQQIWADVLRCPLSSIPMTQSFLRVGGDSISAMQVVSRARVKGINIFVQDVLRLKTIRKLARQATDVGTIAKPAHQVGRYELLTSKSEDLDRCIANCVSRLNLKDSSVIEDIFPCSPMQEGILISQAKTRSNYQVKALFKVLVEPTQSVELDKLEQAWALVAQRHQALRSVLIEGATGQANFLQVVLKEVSVPIQRLDCDSVEKFRDFSETNAYAEDGPPYRVSIFKTQRNEVYCQLAISHVLDDGSSMQVLIRDICLAYDNMLPAGPAPLYSNFISYIRSQPAEASLDFWKTYLDGLVPTHLPALQKTTNEPAQTAAFDYMIEGEKVAKILAFCERFDITVADIFKTVWALILSSFLGTESVCFGHLASGRDTPIQDVHNIVGPLINMLVFRADIVKSTKVIDLLQETHEGYIKALSHQYSSLKEISHAIGSGQTTLFNTLVNVQRATSDFFAHQGDLPAQQTITLRNVDLDDPTEVCYTFVY
jgi:amino acid adenylation domain-containing protein